MASKDKETTKLLGSRDSSFRVAVVSFPISNPYTQIDHRQINIPALCFSFNIKKSHQRQALIEILGNDPKLVERYIIDREIKITLIGLDIDEFAQQSVMLNNHGPTDDYFHGNFSDFQTECWRDVLGGFRYGDHFRNSWGIDVADLTAVFKWQVKNRDENTDNTKPLEIIIIYAHGYVLAPYKLGEGEFKSCTNDNEYPVKLVDLIKALGDGDCFGYNADNIDAVVLRSCYMMRGSPRGSGLMGIMKTFLPNAVLIGSPLTSPNEQGVYSIFPWPDKSYGLISLEQCAKEIYKSQEA